MDVKMKHLPGTERHRYIMSAMNTFTIYMIICMLALTFQTNQVIASEQENDIPSLHNPFSVSFIQDNLSQSKPRMIYTEQIVQELREKIKTDPVIANMYKAIRIDTYRILNLPIIHLIRITRKMDNSRELLRRVNMLGLVYLVEGDKRILERINQEVLAVCSFSDWNPPVYLDVAEIAMAVALALDWTADQLPESTIQIAKKALIEKGIYPSWEEYGGNKSHAWWIDHYNNWNQVCNGGMIAASIAIAEDDPKLAAKTIKRALDGLPNALYENYYPDGVCPEGTGYWIYATSYSLLTASILETAFGSDFGHKDFPGFMESAYFKMMCSDTPSGLYYDFGDNRDKPRVDGDIFLAWFAAQTGKSMFYDKEKFLTPADDIRLHHLTGAALAWMSQYNEISTEDPPSVWVGLGHTPIAVFRGNTNDGYYFAAKGGCGAVSHGHMDAGSFIFELNGVRWSIDLGRQDYLIGERGFDLWRQGQDDQRWELLSMHNKGHSTLTINDQRHIVDGYSLVKDFKKGEQPEVTFDLTPGLEGYVKSATRTFVKKDDYSLDIEDSIEINETTNLVNWQFITRAEVEIIDGGAILRQDGQELRLSNNSHPGINFSVVSLDPPPHKLDKHVDNLKRIELRILANSEFVVDNKINIKIGLEGM